LKDKAQAVAAAKAKADAEWAERIQKQKEAQVNLCAAH
jgi:hypothetical protein